MAATDVDVLEAQAAWAGAGEFLGTAQSIATAFNLIGDRADAASQKQLAVGLAAGAGAATIVAALGRMALAAGEDEAAFARASNSFRAAGNSFPSDELQEFTGALERQTGIADDAIAGAVGLLGTFRLTKEQAQQLTPAILDTAEALKAQGVSAEGLAVQVGKALESGKTEGLRRVGIVIDPAEVARVGVFAAVIDGLRKNGEGAAAVFRGTLPGSIQAARTSLGEFGEEVGRGIVPVLTFAADGIARVTEFIKDVPGAAQVAGAALGIGALALGYYSAQTLLAFRQTVLYTAALANQAVAARGAAAANAANAAATAAAGNAAGGAAGAAGLGGIGNAAVGGFSRAAGLFNAGVIGLPAAAAIAGGHALGGTGGAALEGAGTGAIVGGIVGSVVPVIGNVVGAAAGAAVGAAVGALGNVIAQRDEADAKKARDEQARATADPHLAELQRIVELQRQQIAVLKGFSRAPVDVRGTNARIPEADLARALRAQFPLA